MKNVTCKLCGKNFNNNSNMNRHLKTVHQELKRHECSICGKKFTQAGDVKVHIKQVHETLKHQCKKCNKLFKTVKSLNVHTKTEHSKEYQCKNCFKRLTSLSYLKRHIPTCYRSNVENEGNQHQQNDAHKHLQTEIHSDSVEKDNTAFIPSFSFEMWCKEGRDIYKDINKVYMNSMNMEKKVEMTEVKLEAIENNGKRNIDATTNRLDISGDTSAEMRVDNSPQIYAMNMNIKKEENYI